MSVNKVILLGYVGQDPATFFQGNNEVIANISLATTEKWKDKNGEQQEKTEWHRIVFFGKLAGVVEKYVKKGAHLYIEGKLQTRKWQDKTGRDCYTTEVVAAVMDMLGSKPRAEESPVTEPKPAPTSPGDFDDDLPF